jgi:hypothetical protein
MHKPQHHNKFSVPISLDVEKGALFNPLPVAWQISMD